ncbi:MAG: ferrous iron transport protein A [Deltaproteobacteria bacterium]|nr:ferrous iron transport protein A [Deltaproteobacteria bacterium]
MCPLCAVENGQMVEVMHIRGGRGMTGRLAVMGIFPGTRLRMVQNGKPGPVMVALDEKRFGIGYGMAHRIFVRPVE